MRGREDASAGSPRATLTRLSACAPAGVLMLGLSVLVLPACGRSPGTTFFVLSAVRPDARPRSVSIELVQLRAVHIPELLDRTERVSEQSGDRLQINQFQQWGAPLGDMIRRVLSEDLAARLPVGAVVPPNAPAPPGTRGLVVDVQEFLPESNGQVVLQAAWTVLAASGNPPTAAQGTPVRRSQGGAQGGGSVLAAGMRRLALPAGASADAQVRAMSRLLGQLADAIAAGLSRPRSS